jgi:Domain of unknown function (DUF4406)
MRIYVAGPYTKGDVALNVRRSIEAGNNIAALGHTPFIPHLTHFWHMLFPREIDFWYKQDMEWLKICDVVYRLEGESHGTDEEIKVAKTIDIPVFTDYAELYKWLKEEK